MIVGIAHLFNQTKENIAAIRGVKVSGFVDSNEIACVNNRAVQVCTLDFLLELHRKKYGNNCNGLNGIQALHHKLLMKYQWPPSVIRGLSLSDIFLSLHDELQLESLPEDAGRYLLQITRTQYPINFPDYLDGEWDPNLSQRFLTEIPD
ncbi:MULTISPECIES: hypothetical protein [Kosakonia]|uniref:ECs1072 family phage-associated protein n=1 Tax=Kosakonia TaxID=1330547 RepID=UPI0005ED5A67|nr:MULTISPECIES: hypothetical protein [Kosakonia]RCX00575.1 hypothetical protein DFO56_10517 [Kosakonia sp. AG348]